MTRSRTLDTVVAVLSVAVVAILVGGWYALGAVTPTPRTPVGDQPYRLGRTAGASVTLRAPAGWDRVPTGDFDILKFVDRSGGVLIAELTTGLKDFATAAPRRLRELQYSHIDAHFTGATSSDAGFAGDICDATAGARTGTCAVVGRKSLLVTVLALAPSGGQGADVGAVVRSLRAEVGS
ncbi:hypothetical protein GCM10023147_46650 [Tsukamurella soli]|uniref:Uncharacterized protein n=1 Tax=Tsukamurella soli TaxID=644556 RepID=A0ABP8KCV2_9ACTN